MSDRVIFEGMVRGLKDMGCKIDKITGNELFLTIPKSFTDKMLSLANKAFKEKFLITLRYKRV